MTPEEREKFCKEGRGRWGGFAEPASEAEKTA